MTLAHPRVPLMIAAILAGCTAGPSLAEGSPQELTRPQDAQKQQEGAAAEERKRRVAENWDKLRAGMLVDDIDRLVGPIDVAIKGAAKDSEADSSNPRISGSSCQLRYENSLYVIELGGAPCALIEFRLKQPAEPTK
jgi:hypothetical protein